MKILIADKFPDKKITVLKEQGHEVACNPSLDETTLSEEAKTYQPDIIIVRSTKVNAATIDASAALKMVIRAGAGYDTIDTAHASSKGVAVCNCPGTNSIAVAELAMGLILALDRRIYDNVADLRAGKWNKTKYSKAKGIYGRTIGIIGLGNIGKEVAKRAKAFGLNIIGFDRSMTAETAKEYGITLYNDVYKIAAEADIITLHIPNTPETKGFYNKKFFDLMKPGAYIINTSRGGLIVEGDLIAACKEKGIMAGLDVYEHEPKADALEFKDPICQEPNIYGTHHIGASTDQAQDSVSDLALFIIDKFVKEKVFLHQVNK
ncbi:D-3-phosphoglycerate dehydrogenase [Elusimicrobium simillimum]|uniref:NAD(P)-dependent oxidoreductase n=1 Tax=Elusimicrobium simillimum TaxID=3143438 RepID=UPI003C6FF819